jgi:hypothetical protein
MTQNINNVVLVDYKTKNRVGHKRAKVTLLNDASLEISLPNGDLCRVYSSDDGEYCSVEISSFSNSEMTAPTVEMEESSVTCTKYGKEKDGFLVNQRKEIAIRNGKAYFNRTTVEITVSDKFCPAEQHRDLDPSIVQQCLPNATA